MQNAVLQTAYFETHDHYIVDVPARLKQDLGVREGFEVLKKLCTKEILVLIKWPFI